MLKWLDNYKEAMQLYSQQKDSAAAELFWKSAIYFTDSYIAGDCHYYLSGIYAEKDPEFAEMEKRRYEEFFAKIEE
jgi:hypothetical protein